jgi:hypothetical protein
MAGDAFGMRRVAVVQGQVERYGTVVRSGGRGHVAQAAITFEVGKGDRSLRGDQLRRFPHARGRPQEQGIQRIEQEAAETETNREREYCREREARARRTLRNAKRRSARGVRLGPAHLPCFFLDASDGPKAPAGIIRAESAGSPRSISRRLSSESKRISSSVALGLTSLEDRQVHCVRFPLADASQAIACTMRSQRALQPKLVRRRGSGDDVARCLCSDVFHSASISLALQADARPNQ